MAAIAAAGGREEIRRCLRRRPDGGAARPVAGGDRRRIAGGTCAEPHGGPVRRPAGGRSAAAASAGHRTGGKGGIRRCGGPLCRPPAVSRRRGSLSGTAGRHHRARHALAAAADRGHPADRGRRSVCRAAEAILCYFRPVRRGAFRCRTGAAQAGRCRAGKGRRRPGRAGSPDGGIPAPASAAGGGG